MVAKKTADRTAEKAVGKAAGKATAAENAAPARKATAVGKKAAKPVAGTAVNSVKSVKPVTPVTGATTAAAKKAAAKKTVAKKAAAGKSPAKKTSAVNTAAVDKVAAKKATGVGKTTARNATAKAAGAEGAAHAAQQTGARKVVAKKSTGTARKTAAAATSGLPKARATAGLAPGELAVRPGEDPWTPAEVAEARSELQSEVLRLRHELQASDEAISGLMRDSGDGAGDDQADTGTKNITRESELALAANAREMLEQTERALERLDAGTYGLCENCGQPIGKARMQAFPRATLCVDCKQKQERRH
ncbi:MULTISPECIES: TraR/DksA family transcriptional regulator [unclassified Streptomyces]|uniref:TraR/DksA family transcriptional regulator n=1 Tax=unclassified Streptomyces TaxID=2593676 RepID=UPI002E164F10|nr:TraR/DksA family transcriptional regulator [Streptomyces sp. NBC_01296]WSW59253.1 TraR/DksA family transcriptional regulator [Streptomyces sp. NBC_00998]